MPPSQYFRTAECKLTGKLVEGVASNRIPRFGDLLFRQNRRDKRQAKWSVVHKCTSCGILQHGTRVFPRRKRRRTLKLPTSDSLTLAADIAHLSLECTSHHIGDLSGAEKKTGSNDLSVLGANLYFSRQEQGLAFSLWNEVMRVPEHTQVR